MGEFPRGRENAKIIGKLEQDIRNIAGIPSGPLDLEVLS